MENKKEDILEKVNRNIMIELEKIDKEECKKYNEKNSKTEPPDTDRKQGGN